MPYLQGSKSESESLRLHVLAGTSGKNIFRYPTTVVSFEEFGHETRRGCLEMPCTSGDFVSCVSLHASAFFSGWRRLFENPKTPSKALSSGAHNHVMYFSLSLYLQISPKLVQVFMSGDFCRGKSQTGFKQVSLFTRQFFGEFRTVEVDQNIGETMIWKAIY